MKIILIVFLVTLFFASCHSPSNKLAADRTTTGQSSAIEVGLRFINNYVSFWNTNTSEENTIGWILENPDATKNFKKEVVKMMREARREDPEYGIGFDPILDAQDFPEDGCKLKSYDPSTGYLFLTGKTRDDIELTLKMVKEEGNWKVDGSGVVNIPDEFRGDR